MAKPMTSEQIEIELQALIDADSKLAAVDGTGSRRIGSVVRQAFTLGQDNGKAIMLERAESLLAPRVTDEKSYALGAAVTQIIAWVSALSGRSWNPQSTAVLLFASEQEPPIDPIGGATGTIKFCYGADAHESITVAATWCAEHMKNSAPKVPDTLPTPAHDESDLAELAENRATADAWEKAHGDTEEFGGSDF